MTTIRPRTLLSIQYLRGIAALVVVAAHMPWFQCAVGAVGVDVFFVISGFIMANVSRRETTPRAFLTARALRVVPLYWVMTAVEMVAQGEYFDGRVLASLLFIPTLDQNDWFMPIVGQGWTLTYEMFFYACFGVGLTLSLSRRLPILTLAFVIFCVVQAVLDPSAFATRGISAAPLMEFLFGIWLHRAWQAEQLPNTTACVAVAAASLLVFLYTWSEVLPPWRVIVWGLPAVAIVAAGLAVERGGRLPSSRILLMLGNASYALYLVHPLVQQVLKPVVKPLPLPVALAVLLVACVLAGLAVHRLVERPMAAWLARKVYGANRNGALERVPAKR